MTLCSKLLPSPCLIHFLLPQTKKNHLELTTNLDCGSQRFGITTTSLIVNKYTSIQDIKHNKVKYVENAGSPEQLLYTCRREKRWRNKVDLAGTACATEKQ
ncbi:hypothetical protein QQF64_031549 [Cirrhinus molitorella]|uniref:Uncharacterized protein n=1 Tax=Cirrhinus molitorella TaxID=172907 RepID=A0ABR3MXF7_9TELE